ncbi:MAG: pentapeptide repeat-containing protein, partial [bacterium]
MKRADGRAASLFLSATAVPPTTLMLNYDQPQPDPAPPATLDVLFRFYPDGTQIGALQEGEVAIFQECGYQGKAAVFALDTPNLAQLTSPVVTLDKSAASIRLGNDTAVILHTGQIYTGTQQIVEANTPCLASTPIGNGTTSSLQIRPLAPTILLSSRSCENCQLRGVDVSGLDLSGMDLKGADLTEATLIGTNLAAAILEQAILDGVSGTDQVSG